MYFTAKLVFSSHSPTQALYFSNHSTWAPSSNYTMWLHARQKSSKSDLYKSSPPNSTPVTKPTPAPKCPRWLLALYSNPAFREIVSQDEGKKCVVIFPSPFCPHLSSQCLREVTLLWFEWPHTLGELLWPLRPPTPTTKYSSKQISFNVHCKPEDEGFHFTSCCCSFLHNLAKMQ